MATVTTYLDRISESKKESLIKSRDSEYKSLGIQLVKADKEQQKAAIEKKMDAVLKSYNEQLRHHLEEFMTYRHTSLEIKKALKTNAPTSPFRKIFPMGEMYDRIVELNALEVLVDEQFDSCVKEEASLDTIIANKDELSDIILRVRDFSRGDIDDVLKERYDHYRSQTKEQYHKCINKIAEDDSSELEEEVCRLSKILGLDEAKRKEDISRACKEHYESMLSKVRDPSSGIAVQVKEYSKRLGIQEQEVDAQILAAIEKNEAQDRKREYNKKISLYSYVAIALLSVIEILTIRWWSFLAIPATVATGLFIRKRLLKNE